jgi:UDP-N-acetylmuramate: L-alanyl-gamma-D-glutamyl-meso-diaminopimelate ligase
VLTAAGRDPSFLVGGVARNYDANFRLGAGPHFVVEGDEYDTAYFDKGAKFLHYRPRTTILTSVEFDHADIFRDLPHYEAAFERFVRLLPPDGCLAVGAGYANARRIARSSAARVATYGLGASAAAAVRPDDLDYTVRDLTHGAEGARFTVVERGRVLGRATLPGGGAQNVENALGVVAATRALGLDFDEISGGFATFAGVRRRQEVRGEVRGITVVDDFAHHPTAVRATIAALQARFPGRRLWAAFEPRSNTSRRRVHQQEYVEALAGAPSVLLKVPEPHDMVPADQRLDADQVVADLRARGVDARADADVDRLVQAAVEGARPGDVVLAMSNGAFGGFVDRLLAALR